MNTRSLAGSAVETVIAHGRPVIETFYAAVLACGRKPAFKPDIRVSNTPGTIQYDGSVVLEPYEVLEPPRLAAMERFAAVGTLGLSGREQYIEVFNSLLVAHELGHWLQHLAQRALSPWQAEYGANRVMVAFWRDHPDRTHAATTEQRLTNFVAQSPTMPSPLPADAGMNADEYFDAHYARIAANPVAYAAYQKMMVRLAIAERPQPSFCDVVNDVWPR
jgi:hypothetical protein